MFFGQAFLIAFIITLIFGVISFIQASVSSNEKSIGGTVTGVIVSFIFTFLISLSMLWWGTPAHTGTMGGYGWIILPIIASCAIFFLCDGIALSGGGPYSDNVGVSAAGIIAFLAVLAIVMIAGCSNWVPLSQSEANKLGGSVSIIREEADAYPDTDTNHIIQVPEENARFKASQVIAKQVSDENGKSINLSTSYQMGPAEIQSVNDHLYWIFGLDFSGWRTWDRVGQISPGYIVVDAEDPEGEATVKLGYKMKYTPSAFFDSKLQRYLYTNGYAGYSVDDLSLEVDDNWQPFYTASLNKRTIKNSGEIPVGMIVVDPQTGKITRYKIAKAEVNLQSGEVKHFDGETPAWVDRVYSKNAAKRMMNWWGDYGDPKNAPWKWAARPQTGRFKVADNPVLVYTKSGHPAWQMTMTSLKKDTSIIDVVLFDTVVNEARIYRIIEGTATEPAVKKTFNSIQENVRGDYVATHLSLHKIYGQPTWVANYVLKSEDSSQGEPYVGIGFVNAHDLQTSNVAFGKTKEEALAKYRQLLARNPDTSIPDEGSSTRQTVRGVVRNIAMQIQNGNTVYLFVLSENPSRVFKAAREVSNELPFIKEGDTVEVVFDDLGQVPIDITSVNDLNIPIVP